MEIFNTFALAAAQTAEETGADTFAGVFWVLFWVALALGALYIIWRIIQKF